MNKQEIDISIIIVNYKVREYISNLLSSISRAEQNLTLEIFVVDNNSDDGSVDFLKKRFPDIRYIENLENVGFGKANNQAIKEAKGTFTLIINPDTLVSEDTFSVLVEHMDNHPLCGAAGCKILNPDGTFAPESKRSVPTLWSSISKVTGLSSLFPTSKLFEEYYLNSVEENEKASVPVLSGSFMFWRTKLLKELGGFDERFFMYGEDIDLCYRVQDTEYHIDYVPETSIIHYKGESSKKGDLRYIRVFNKALYQFFDKHHSSRYSFFFKIFIYSAIWLRALISVITSNFLIIGYLTSDLILLNVSVILGFLIRFQFSYEVFTDIQNLKFLWINLLASLIYLFIGGFLDLFRSKKDSISNQIKAIIGSYSGVALITFFVREYAFSRLALIYGLIAALFLMLLLKLIQINLANNDAKVTGKLKRLRVLLVGDSDHTDGIKSKIHSRPDWNYEITGTVGIDKVNDGDLGELAHIKELIKVYKVDQVFFALSSISYKNMLRQISILQNERVVFKLIPDSMDFILGKSNVEYLESIPLVEVGFSFSKGINHFLKRGMDIVIAFPLLIILAPITLPGILFSKYRKEKVSNFNFYNPPKENKWKNRLILFWYILKGDMSLVGGSINTSLRNPQLKPAMTGTVQMNESRIQTEEDKENYELYYLQNYSIWMDIDILLKSFFVGNDFSEFLNRAIEKKS